MALFISVCFCYIKKYWYLGIGIAIYNSNFKRKEHNMQELTKQINKLKKLIEYADGDDASMDVVIRNLNRMKMDMQEIVDHSSQIKDAYQDDEGVWRWKSNDRVPFSDMLGAWGLDDETFAKCVDARDKDTEKSLAEYRERMKDYVPSDEEMFEMKAAFGEGTTVVNVITGKQTILL